MLKSIKVALVGLTGLIIGILGDVYLLAAGNSALASIVHGGWFTALWWGFLVAQACGLVSVCAIAIGWGIATITPNLTNNGQTRRIVKKYDKK